MTRFPFLHFFSCLTLVGASTLPSSAQDIAGTWYRAQQALGYTDNTDTTGDVPLTFRIFDKADLETEVVTLNPDGTLQIGSETANWFFNNGEVVVVTPDGVHTQILSAQADTFVDAEQERIVLSTAPNQAIFQGVTLSIGLQRPDSINASDIEGEWILYRQQVHSSQTPNPDNVLIDQLQSFGFQSERAVFDGSDFTVEMLMNTADPSEVGQGFSGTWSVSDNALTVNIPGQGSLVQSNFSAGKDSALRVFRETESLSPATFREDQFEVWVKIAPSLSASDILGTWRHVTYETVFDDDSGDGPIDYVKFNYEIAEFRFFSDGSGIREVLETGDGPRDGPEAFTWSIADGNEVRLTNSGESETVQISAGKDFGVHLDVVDAPGTGYDEYSFGMFIKQSPQAVAGFADNRPALTFDPTTDSNASIALTSIPGIYYQLQRKIDLATDDWTPVGAPVLGDGAPVTLEDLSPPNERAFYRVTVVPPPSVP